MDLGNFVISAEILKAVQTDCVKDVWWKTSCELLDCGLHEGPKGLETGEFYKMSNDCIGFVHC